MDASLYDVNPAHNFTPTGQHAAMRRSHLIPATATDAWDTRLLWASLFLTLAIFAKAPNLDVWVSQRYYSAQGFLGADMPWVIWVHRFVPGIGYGLLALGAAVLLLSPVLKWMAAHGQQLSLAQVRQVGMWQRTAVSGLLVAGLCSGLIVHWGFKAHMGRPRPVDTIAFGGTQSFVPVFHQGSTPERHNSFVSGHAATGFSLMALGLGAGLRWRRRWFLIGLVAGSLVSLARVMQGAHFLSDVVFSFHAVWLSCEAVACLMSRPFLARLLPPPPPE
jgi:lipid A 4'-phosphatase